MQQRVTDEGDARQYWTQLPNIVFEIGLKPLELTLYAHLKRAAGASAAGKCFKSTATLARETGMGAGTVSRTKAMLEAKHPALGNRPLIRTKEVPNPRGGKPFQEITITDIWKANTDRFTSSPVEVAPSSVEVGAVDQVPVEVGSSSKPISTLEIKNNVEEELREEKQNPSAHAELMGFLSTKIGHIPNGGQQGKAVKWLLERYDPVECFGCFNFLAGQAWRSTPVTWTTVQSNIGAWIARMPMGAPNGRAATTTPRPLPKGVCLWGCECGFSVVQNGSGIKQCPECKLQLSEI